ncbi:glycosyltransferase [Micrococcus luteus]|uniref:glycosyltransferase n=1 Tax=Micrococcus TaxID=1269 RepID=UPI00044AC05C|nr:MULTISPECIES: glycosyltransferase [Micrococcus]EZP31006.1 Glycosyltransferase, group 2 family protein [Micrococcus luteus]MBY0173961.1 glycosyltransferase [Micrococcus luteus]MCD0179378.1 glycosyltransferase [Micrococcus luteus]MCD0181101.1 glycosyltransferase [Micrococcus luteus]MCK6109947.1 glycosyltransferase [Micrococcus luteus]
MSIHAHSASTPTAPSVSVVIPVYNGARTLPLQLEALRTQVGAPPFEVIVVDNRSTDDLQGAMRPFMESGPSLRVVRAEAHQGSSYARNRGIAAARAPYVMFCDADDVVSRHWVAAGAAAFGTTSIWTGSVTHLPAEIFDQGLDAVRDRLGDELQPQDGPGREVSGPFPVLMGGDFGASRQLLEAVGGFDQSFPHAGDDNDLAFRVLRAGHRLVEMPQVRVASRGKASPRAARKIAFRSAKAHALLADRYGVWDRSRATTWASEPVRCLGAALKMAAHPTTADWRGLASRTAMAAGTLAGAVEYHLLRRRPTPQVGLGLGPDDPALPGEVRQGAGEPGDPELVSVIIPAYNAEAYIAEQIESLAVQVDPPEFEVIVADNGSTDRTVSATREAAKRYGLTVTVVDARGPASASHARNVGALAAAGEVLLFCDADDFVGPEWVRELAAAVRSREDALAVGTLLHRRFNDAAVLAAYDIPSEVGVPGTDATGYPVVHGGFAGHLPTVAGNDFGVRRSMYLAAGGMDSSFPGGSEETDFSWRAQRRGVVVVHAPHAVVHYRLRSTPQTVFRQQRIQQVGRMLLWIRHRHEGMSGPSWRVSATEVARHLPAYVVTRERGARLRHARIAGGHLGALQGMVRYRLLKRIPPRRLMDGASAVGF